MADVFIGTQALETGLPFVTNPFPTPGAMDVPLDTDITFTVLDDVGGTGVDINSIDVDVDGTPAIIDGVFQPGYTGSITPNGNGFDVVVNPDVDLPGSQIITIDVHATDLAEPPNVVDFTWDFSTVAAALGEGGPRRWQWRYIFGLNRRSRSHS